MTRPTSAAARLVAAIVAAGLVTGCSSSDDTAAPSSSASATGTSSSTSSGSSTRQDPDPEVSVSASSDAPQSSAERDHGIKAADSGEEAIRLEIPAVGLSAKLEPQGLRGGKVNPRPHEVIWFTGHDRVRPGAKGTSVIAGHVISGGEADEFAALEQLSKGDGIAVSYPSGARLRLEVVSTEIVDKTDLQRRPEVWGKNADSRRVVLVTCDDELGFREDGHRKANFVAVAELR